MSRIIIIIITFILINSCSIINKNIEVVEKRMIKSDYIDTVTYFKIKQEILNSGWVEDEEIKNTKIRNNKIDFELRKTVIFKEKDSINDSKETVIWNFFYTKKGLVFENYNCKFNQKCVTNTLKTNKKDTLFWNVVNIVRNHCELKDTIYKFKVNKKDWVIIPFEYN